MKPILLIHGYASEGKDKLAKDIYGSLPEDLRKRYGEHTVLDLNLSRWISLNDGIALDDVSFAMDRALKALSRRKPNLLRDGFHVIIHSTGALVVRNWIKLFCDSPCPIINFIHLAGANFGSGLAHVGRGQLARWKRKFAGTGRGMKVLNELELGAWKTLDLQQHFLEDGQDIYDDYQVQEFCLIGSQTNKNLRHVPIRYVKEDSSDNTIRTSSGNLNFNYLSVQPTQESYNMSISDLEDLEDLRLEDKRLHLNAYEINKESLANDRTQIPYYIAYETSHFGDRIGIVTGKNNRERVLPLIFAALETPFDKSAYAETTRVFEKNRQKTFDRVKRLTGGIAEWNKQRQYEGHAQLIFRLRDQFGVGVKDYDINFRSIRPGDRIPLEKMIEHRHINKRNDGTITFYLRTQKFENNEWIDLLDTVPSVHFEVTAHEEDSEDIRFVPLNLEIRSKQLKEYIQTFRTTIIDIRLLRLPTKEVFKVTKHRS